ncbi:hypothetical protein LUZ60_003711 [Juncus effusus]|nr:hypothetical protein LUZ60_003711 [Juncus effusus]
MAEKEFVAADVMEVELDSVRDSDESDLDITENQPKQEMEDTSEEEIRTEKENQLKQEKEYISEGEISSKKENQPKQETEYTSEEEIRTEKDQTNMVEDTPESLMSLIQALDDETLIQSPILKSITNPEIQSSALKILRTKYNDMLEKFQTASNKCKEDCEPKYNMLKKKYTDECLERKRLYNELIEMRGNIRVFCRCRPISSDEISKGYSNVVEFDSSHENELQIICNDSSKKQFKFDHVFDPSANQEAVFSETLPVVMSALDGYNVCIFAYGQTGTGKTYTMDGTIEDRGVNYRALEVLFDTSRERESDLSYGFSVSMLEVYNEKIRDLLAESTDQNGKKLEIKQSSDGTQEVPGLIESDVNTINEVWDILRIGAKNRSVGSTAANEQSSRSHCLVRVTIRSENLVTHQRSKSNMWLVDLAGSERVSKIEAEGERLKESQFINKSLSALGDVISALASKNNHIPYRNSKLTHLLQSSLGGDCKTLMFVQISPSSSDLAETICSLNFATRVRGIEQGPARKQSDPAEAIKLKQIMEKLRQEEKENARLNDSLQLLNLKFASRENVFKTLQEKIRDAEQQCKTYQQRVRDLENQISEGNRTTTNSTIPKFTKPPLAPPVRRAPLGRITNRLPPIPSQKPLSFPSFSQNKENNNNNNISEKAVGKARRVSIVPAQQKRRSSLAILPAYSLKDPHRINTERKMAELERQLSQLGPRRRSFATYNPYPVTATCSRITPDSVGKFKSFFGSSSKYSSMGSGSKYAVSPKYNYNNNVGTGVSKLKLPGVRLQPTRFSDVNQGSKLGFAVQKRVLIGSPAKLQRKQELTGSGLSELWAMKNLNLNGGGMNGGAARRVLCNGKRRVSII